MTDLAAPFRARIEDVRLPANVPAGCNPLVVMSLTYLLRATTEDPEPAWSYWRGTGRGVCAMAATGTWPR